MLPERKHVVTWEANIFKRNNLWWNYDILTASEQIRKWSSKTWETRYFSAKIKVLNGISSNREITKKFDISSSVTVYVYGMSVSSGPTKKMTISWKSHPIYLSFLLWDNLHGSLSDNLDTFSYLMFMGFKRSGKAGLATSWDMQQIEIHRIS